MPSVNWHPIPESLDLSLVVYGFAIKIKAGTGENNGTVLQRSKFIRFPIK
jgi:hypothetical protein